MKHALALLTLVLANGAAADGCPTADDLGNGVTLLDSTRDVRIEHQLLDGSLTVSSHRSLSIDEVVVRHRTSATYPHPLALRDDHPEFAASYQRPTDGLDDLRQTGEWTSRFTVIYRSVHARRGEHRISLESVSTVSIGECTYEVWIVNDSVQIDEQPVHQTRKWYAPDLGIIVAQTGRFAIGQEMSDEFAFDQIVAE